MGLGFVCAFSGVILNLDEYFVLDLKGLTNRRGKEPSHLVEFYCLDGWVKSENKGSMEKEN